MRTDHVFLVAAVSVGGATGAVSRYLLTEAFPTSATDFPWTTFAINVSGAMLLALLAALPFVRRHPWLPPLLGTGVLGGFTTLSAYSEQTRSLLASGHQQTAFAYLFGTLAACVAAVWIADRLSTPLERAELHAEEGDL